MENVYSTTDLPTWTPTRREKLLAWTAHLFTATGVLWGMLAVLAVINQQWILAFAWMSVAILVDSVDGLLARRLRVKEAIPEFDGALLDNIVDYLNYTFVPAFFLVWTDLLPPRIAFVAAALVLLASAYQFCQSDAKTADHYFKGFPSYWNIMVYYMFIVGWNPWVNLVIVTLLTIFVFVPIKYIYPSRTRLYQGLTLTLVTVWGITNVVIMVTYPNHQPWQIWLSLSIAIYYMGMSLYATFRTEQKTRRAARSL
ncbi:MAG: CDP-alcohol phosphatidyltransferase family protein [Litorilinea sp.]